jgi:hypothetical protein
LFASGGARRAIAPLERRKREIFTIKWYGLRKTFVVLLGGCRIIPINTYLRISSAILPASIQRVFFKRRGKMEGASFRIYNKSKLFVSIAAVCVIFFLFGCGPAKIIKGQKAPQGTYECIRGYERITCPECSGRGTLQISPWEQQSKEKRSTTKSPLLGTLSFFSKDQSPSRGFKKCWQCGGHGIVCKRDESVALPASSVRGSWKETKIREAVYMARSYRDFILIDKFDSPVGDVFYAAAVPRPLESGPADIPIDAITYGLTEFAGLEKNYKFFSRFASSIKEGVAMKGQCIIRCIYNGNPMHIRFCYYPKHKHLEVQAGSPLDEKVYAIDLSKVDVSIDK